MYKMDYINKYTLVYYSLMPNLPLDIIRNILDIFNNINKFMSSDEVYNFVKTIIGFDKLTLPYIPNCSEKTIKEIIELKLVKIVLDHIHCSNHDLPAEDCMTNVFIQLYFICDSYLECNKINCESAKIQGKVCIHCTDSSNKVIVINDIELCIKCIKKLKSTSKLDINKIEDFKCYYDKFIEHLNNTCYHYIIFDYGQRKMVCLSKDKKIKRNQILKEKLRDYVFEIKTPSGHNKAIYTRKYANLCMATY